MPKIAVIDNVTLDESDKKRLGSLGKLKIFKGMPKSGKEIISRIGDNEIVVAGGCDIPAEAMLQAKNLKMIAVWGTGYDHVPLEAAKKKGVVVTNVPGYAAESVAEHSFALMLSVIRKIPQANNYVKSGHWRRGDFKGFELKGKTIGIIGTGAIGAYVAKLAHCFGMKVIAFTGHPSAEKAKELGLEYVSLEGLLKRSDIVTIHTPLTPNTKGMLGKKEFGLVKKGAILINTARAGIIEQKHLIEALESGRLAGAGLDMLEKEPPEDGPLRRMENIIITPHCGSYTDDAIRRCTDGCIENIERFLEGKTQNVVER